MEVPILAHQAISPVALMRVQVDHRDGPDSPFSRQRPSSTD